MSGISNLFGTSLANLSVASAQLQFELQFRQIESTVVNRVNEEIEKIAAETDSTAEIQALQDERDRLAAELPTFETFRLGNQINQSRLTEVGEKATAAVAGFSTDDDDTNLTADEASALNIQIADIVQDIKNLLVVDHPDIIEGLEIDTLKSQAATLETLVAVEGTVDASGSGSPSNDNRTILDLLESIESGVAVAQSGVTNLIELTNELIINANNLLLEIEARATEITLVDAREQAERIQAVRAENANLLNLISLSFEASTVFTSFLAANVGDQRPAPGSVLNLFI